MRTWTTLIIGILLLTPSVGAQTFGGEFTGTVDTKTEDENNPFGATGGGLGIFDLLHRSNLANPKSFKDFKKDANQNMADEITKFRSRNTLKITPELIQPQAKGTTNTVTGEIIPTENKPVDLTPPLP